MRSIFALSYSKLVNFTDPFLRRPTDFIVLNERITLEKVVENVLHHICDMPVGFCSTAKIGYIS